MNVVIIQKLYLHLLSVILYYYLKIFVQSTEMAEHISATLINSCGNIQSINNVSLNVLFSRNITQMLTDHCQYIYTHSTKLSVKNDGKILLKKHIFVEKCKKSSI
jgi:hypothetical protein